VTSKELNEQFLNIYIRLFGLQFFIINKYAAEIENIPGAHIQRVNSVGN